MTAGAREREDEDGNVRYRAWSLWPHLPGRMDDEDVATADLKDVGWRAGIWVSLIRLGLKSHRGRATRDLQWGINGGQGRGGNGVQQWCGLNRAKKWAKDVACPVLR